MQYESSAGGVVVNQDRTKVLLLKDKGNQWTFPKGLIEKGEDTEKTAEREIAEEVGLTNLALLSSLSPIEYFYKWVGNLKKKTVYYFLFAADDTQKLTPQIEEGIIDVQWFPFEEAKELIGYKKTNAKVLEEAVEVIKN